MKTWTDDEEVAAIKLLEHPLRLKAFELLMVERLSAREVAAQLDEREKLVSYHCRRMIRARVVEVMEGEVLRPTPLGVYAREWV
jgi:DNA-binding transcriptional ArsR family regulator